MTENKNNIADAIDEKDKQCSKCGEIEPLSEFSKNGRQKLGVRAACKSCKSEQQKEYYQNNKEAISERQKKYRQNNKEALNEQSKEYYQNNKEVMKKQGKEISKRIVTIFFENMKLRDRAESCWK